MKQKQETRKMLTSSSPRTFVRTSSGPAGDTLTKMRGTVKQVEILMLFTMEDAGLRNIFFSIVNTRYSDFWQHDDMKTISITTCSTITNKKSPKNLL
jgi:hypothetical protein